MTAQPAPQSAVMHHGPVILVAVTAALGGFLFGYDTAVINGTVRAMQAEFALSNLYLGFVVSSALIGSAVGAWFAGPVGLLPIVWVGILLSVFQQFVGINVIFYYSTTLWRAVGFSESSALATSVITSVTNILTTLIAIALIDRIGRKPLLLIGATGMLVTLATMAICFSTATGTGKNVSLPGAAGPIALVAANLYVVSFGMSWGPVVWVLLGEMFNNRIRATALAVAAAAQWLANWAISTTFPALAGSSLALAYGLYALFAALSLIFVTRGVRETKGRELESM